MMGEELGKFTVTVGREFGVVAVLLVLSWVGGILGLSWFLWQTAKTHRDNTKLLADLYSKWDTYCVLFTAHDRQGADLKGDVAGHVADIKAGIVEVKTELKEAQRCLTGVKVEVAKFGNGRAGSGL